MKGMYWYRIEFYESWDVENRLHVAYVAAPRNATTSALHFRLYEQRRPSIVASDENIQIKEITPVEKTIVDDEQGLTNTR